MGNSKEGILAKLTGILSCIKEEINIPDVKVFAFINNDYDLVIEAQIKIIKIFYVRNVFTKREIFEDINNNSLKYFCELCNHKINKFKEELRKGK